MSKNRPKRDDPSENPATGRTSQEVEDAARQKLAADLVEASEAAIDEQLEELHVELEEANDRTLRIQAELENYRKRAARELQDERRYAAMPLLRDLLPVWDNINRAIESAERNHDVAALLEGVKMVAQQLENALQQHDCRRIESLHKPFDPNLHEAISQQPSQEYPSGTVVLETQTGFQVHDRVVRPSQVIVSMESEQ